MHEKMLHDYNVLQIEQENWILVRKATAAEKGGETRFSKDQEGGTSWYLRSATNATNRVIIVM